MGFTAMPYIIFLMAHWNPTMVNYNPYFLMISSIPLPIQLKIHLILTICIAFDRLLVSLVALYCPSIYRRKDHSLYSLVCLCISIAIAGFDIIMEFSSSPFEEKPNCAAIGCFVSNEFRYYWGISNMVLGFIVILFTLLILLKLKLIRINSESAQVLRESHKFARVV
uniref:G_PROTEIN_RECEP_F1_2 domain-containing protein n=1 Tax=Heterorhabditis bacteriophora TaxID=37862 RepID=A0A1I7XEU2_HETBA